MITLAIRRDILVVTQASLPCGPGGWVEFRREGIVQVQMDTRPDPIRRAWAAIEDRRNPR